MGTILILIQGLSLKWRFEFDDLRVALKCEKKKTKNTRIWIWIFSYASYVLGISWRIYF